MGDVIFMQGLHPGPQVADAHGGGNAVALYLAEGLHLDAAEKFRKNEFGANDDRFQIGIRNTKDRLQLLYGAEASLMIGNGENLGTEVIIIIPYQNGDEKSEYSISR